MAEPRGTGAPGGGGVDSELDFRWIFGFVGGLALVCLVVFALMWGLAVLEKRRLVREDAPPPALPEAREKSVPRGPLLQSDPERDLRTFRAREDEVLAGWGWADAARAHARVPVDRALDIVAARGFPPRTAPPPVAVPAPEVKK